MEFRYRANDGDRPPPATDTTMFSHSLNPNSSFLSASPIPGGQSEDHVREAIRREIEKEQIRQEIIAAETTRRRELIAEVIQEMAIEREMAIRRVAETKGTSLDEKLTMLINQRKLPIQNHNNDIFRQKCSYNDPQMHTGPNSLATTSIVESNKEKLIVMDRADPIGTKDTETGLERGKRKADSVEKGLTETLESKRPKRKFRFWCDVCRVGAFTETVMRNHKLGKKHMAAIEKQNETPETAAASTSLITAPVSEDEKKKTVRCEICNVEINSEKMMEIHKLGKKHKAHLKKQCP